MRRTAGANARAWIEQKRSAAEREPRRYLTVADAVARMRLASHWLSHEQVWHLTIHGIRQNGDGSWSWKFDPQLRTRPLTELLLPGAESYWEAITAPTLLFYGADSSASNPARDGRLSHFRDAQVVEIADAGHWLHHDKFDQFMNSLTRFLSESPRSPRRCD